MMLKQLNFFPVERFQVQIQGISQQRLVLLLVLLIAGITHAFNMLDFPFYNNAEGTHVASAYSLIHYGELSPYNYAYDNPPMGALVLAIWTGFSSILMAGGTILPAGPILIFIFHLFTIPIFF